MKETKTFEYCEFCNAAHLENGQRKIGFIRIGNGYVCLDRPYYTVSITGIYCDLECFKKQVGKINELKQRPTTQDLKV